MSLVATNRLRPSGGGGGGGGGLFSARLRRVRVPHVTAIIIVFGRKTCVIRCLLGCFIDICPVKRKKIPPRIIYKKKTG